MLLLIQNETQIISQKLLFLTNIPNLKKNILKQQKFLTILIFQQF